MKRKKINRSLLFFMILGIFVTIVAMSVVYAALSSKLLIDGSAEVPNSSFGIKVEKASIEEAFGSNYLELCAINNANCYDNVIELGNGKLEGTPKVTNTSISDLNMTVQIPGDGVELIYKITNVGSIPMKLHDIVADEFQFVSANNSDADIEWLNENLFFSSGFEKNDADFNINDILCPGESVYYFMIVMIPADVTTIPSGKVEMHSSGVIHEFLQTDQYLCES